MWGGAGEGARGLWKDFRRPRWFLRPGDVERVDRHWVSREGPIDFRSIFKALGELRVKPHLIGEINDFTRVPESVTFLERLGLGE